MKIYMLVCTSVWDLGGGCAVKRVNGRVFAWVCACVFECLRAFEYVCSYVFARLSVRLCVCLRECMAKHWET